MNELNSTLTNAEILKIPGIKEKLDNNHIIVIDKGDVKKGSDGQERQSVFIIGKYHRNAENTGLNSTIAVLSGLNAGREYVRHIANFLTEHADKLEKGDSLTKLVKEKFAIKVEHSTDKRWDNKTPIANRDGELMVNQVTGEAVYEYTNIVPLADILTKGHNTVKIIPESQFVDKNSSVRVEEMQA